jgi:uncharacterized protein (TIGR03067 family)
MTLRHPGIFLSIAALGLVVSGGGPERATARGRLAADADGARFEGKWRVWRSEKNGDTTADSGDGMLIEGKNIQFLWNGDNKGGTATFTVKPDAEPKEIELEHTTGRWRGKKQLGIYRFTVEGQLEICWAEPGVEKRPGKFTGKVTTGAGELAIYRSSKFQLPEALAKELKAFEGKWRGVALHRLGRADTEARAKGEGVVIEGDDMQFLWGGNNKGAKARFLVDPTKDPKQIEIVYTVGQERYKKRIGSYKLTANRLEISLSAPNSDTRPTAFTGLKGTTGAADLFYAYEREKE